MNAGAKRIRSDNYSRKWSKDTGFQGGEAINLRTRLPRNSVVPMVFRTERVNPTSYSLPVSNKKFLVVLRFAENSPDVLAAGDRVFDINVEGTSILGVDIFALAGGKNIAVTRMVEVTVTDGVLDIGFTPINGVPFINAIEVSERLGSSGIGTSSTTAVGATIYSERNFAGAFEQLEAGTYSPGSATLGRVGDDNITSIKVEPGYRVKLCENPDLTGKCVTYKKGRYRIIRRSLDNKISSVLVEEIAKLD